MKDAAARTCRGGLFRATFFILLVSCGASAALAACDEDQEPEEVNALIENDEQDNYAYDPNDDGGLLQEELSAGGLSPLDEFEDSLNKDLIRDKKHDKERRGPKIWDQWGKWSPCSVTCGVGKIVRWRHCVAGGCAPGEKEAQIKSCTLPAC